MPLRDVLTQSRRGRARRALARQLAYQRAKACALPSDTSAIERDLRAHAREVRRRIEAHRAIHPGARVLEVGSGAHGLVFFLDIPGAIGVDPLAEEYAKLFPQWQSRARTIKAFGEALPFPDSSFDIVISDNVVDHAEQPAQIVAEMARVLAPGGILYFTVNVHHAIYALASRFHAAWRYLGPKYEITPFADHTVHLTPEQARSMFKSDQWRVLYTQDDVAAAVAVARETKPRHAGDRLKRVFYKNATFELIAERR